MAALLHGLLFVTVRSLGRVGLGHVCATTNDRHLTHDTNKRASIRGINGPQAKDHEYTIVYIWHFWYGPMNSCNWVKYATTNVDLTACEAMCYIIEHRTPPHTHTHTSPRAQKHKWYKLTHMGPLSVSWVVMPKSSCIKEEVFSSAWLCQVELMGYWKPPASVCGPSFVTLFHHFTDWWQILQKDASPSYL